MMLGDGHARPTQEDGSQWDCDRRFARDADGAASESEYTEVAVSGQQSAVGKDSRQASETISKRRESGCFCWGVYR